MSALPALRADIDAIQAEYEDQPVFVLSDRSGLSKAQLIVSPVVLLILDLCDGTRSAQAIEADFVRATQQDLPPGAVENVCRQLEEALF
ncbi:MAG: hypothetical protein V1918_04310, partial [Planctomycetota bacterium]